MPEGFQADREYRGALKEIEELLSADKTMDNLFLLLILVELVAEYVERRL